MLLSPPRVTNLCKPAEEYFKRAKAENEHYYRKGNREGKGANASSRLRSNASELSLSCEAQGGGKSFLRKEDYRKAGAEANDFLPTKLKQTSYFK